MKSKDSQKSALAFLELRRPYLGAEKAPGRTYISLLSYVRRIRINITLHRDDSNSTLTNDITTSLNLGPLGLDQCSLCDMLDSSKALAQIPLMV